MRRRLVSNELKFFLENEILPRLTDHFLSLRSVLKDWLDFRFNGESETKCFETDGAGQASGNQTSNLILKMSRLATKSDVWNFWEPKAV